MCVCCIYIYIYMCTRRSGCAFVWPKWSRDARHMYLMILQQLTERAESDLVSQQHVAVLWSIDQQVLGSLPGSVGKHVSTDPLADTHQEVPGLALGQQRLGLFTGYYTCRDVNADGYTITSTAFLVQMLLCLTDISVGTVRLTHTAPQDKV